jgi:hypothetical protein
MCNLQLFNLGKIVFVFVTVRSRWISSTICPIWSTCFRPSDQCSTFWWAYQWNHFLQNHGVISESQGDIFVFYWILPWNNLLNIYWALCCEFSSKLPLRKLRLRAKWPISPIFQCRNVPFHGRFTSFPFLLIGPSLQFAKPNHLKRYHSGLPMPDSCLNRTRSKSKVELNKHSDFPWNLRDENGAGQRDFRILFNCDDLREYGEISGASEFSIQNSNGSDLWKLPTIRNKAKTISRSRDLHPIKKLNWMTHKYLRLLLICLDISTAKI